MIAAGIHQLGKVATLHEPAFTSSPLSDKVAEHFSEAKFDRCPALQLSNVCFSI